MLNLKNFEEVATYFKKTIKSLLVRYNLYDFENDVLTKLWVITKNIDINKFKDSKGLDNFIFISLKNFCITLTHKNNYYLSHNVFSSDNNEFYFNSIPFKETNFSNIIFYDLISNLNNREQEIIIYKFKNNLSNIEIGEILGVSRQAVNKALNKLILEV